MSNPVLSDKAQVPDYRWYTDERIAGPILDVIMVAEGVFALTLAASAAGLIAPFVLPPLVGVGAIALSLLFMVMGLYGIISVAKDLHGRATGKNEEIYTSEFAEKISHALANPSRHDIEAPMNFFWHPASRRLSILTWVLGINGNVQNLKQHLLIDPAVSDVLKAELCEWEVRKEDSDRSTPTTPAMLSRDIGIAFADWWLAIATAPESEITPKLLEDFKKDTGIDGQAFIQEIKDILAKDGSIERRRIVQMFMNKLVAIKPNKLVAIEPKHTS